MRDKKSTFSKDNLLRAWRWLNSNPAFFYKNFFRDSYSSYEIALSDNINDLAKRLRDGSYKPTNASLMLLPKTTCTTRPYTLLSVEDQIVYQAIINMIAERFFSRLNKNYRVLTYGNMYAGKKGIFFYKKWDKGYRDFNTAIRLCFNQGYEYKASFDLTACYDSIDHKVLGHILEKEGLDKDLVDFLLNLLSAWSSNVQIYKSHGIPQGPMSSGLLADVFLSYFDEKYSKSKMTADVKYFRYVDDIILMGKDSRHLTKMLASLDFYSKQIGLFPQSSKIEVKKILNLDEEINNFSQIEEDIKIVKVRRHEDIEKKLRATISRNHVIDKTKFKMYLNAVKPNSKLSLYLLDVLSENPQYYTNICYYFSKYPRKISDKVVERILFEVSRPEIYQIISASLIESISFNVSDLMARKIIRFAKDRMKNKKRLTPYYRFVMLRILIEYHAIKYNDLKKFLHSETDWWVKKSIFRFIDSDVFGEHSYHELVRMMIGSEINDVALAGAAETLAKNITLVAPYTDINYFPQITLKYAGVINRARRRPSMISECLNRITETNLGIVNWKTFLGADHNATERKILRAMSYVKSDMSAFVNIMDTINDLLLSKLFMKDTRLGGYNLGNIGGVLYSPSSRFGTHYPSMLAFCRKLHDLRLQCDLSHPVVGRTKKFTAPIPYKQIFEIRRTMTLAFTELYDEITF